MGEAPNIIKHCKLDSGNTKIIDSIECTRTLVSFYDSEDKIDNSIIVDDTLKTALKNYIKIDGYAKATGFITLQKVVEEADSIAEIEKLINEENAKITDIRNKAKTHHEEIKELETKVKATEDTFKKISQEGGTPPEVSTASTAMTAAKEAMQTKMKTIIPENCKTNDETKIKTCFTKDVELLDTDTRITGKNLKDADLLFELQKYIATKVLLKDIVDTASINEIDLIKETSKSFQESTKALNDKLSGSRALVEIQTNLSAQAGELQREASMKIGSLDPQPSVKGVGTVHQLKEEVDIAHFITTDVERDTRGNPILTDPRDKTSTKEIEVDHYIFDNVEIIPLAPGAAAPRATVYRGDAPDPSPIKFYTTVPRGQKEEDDRAEILFDLLKTDGNIALKFNESDTKGKMVNAGYIILGNKNSQAIDFAEELDYCVVSYPFDVNVDRKDRTKPPVIEYKFNKNNFDLNCGKTAVYPDGLTKTGHANNKDDPHTHHHSSITIGSKNVGRSGNDMNPKFFSKETFTDDLNGILVGMQLDGTKPEITSDKYTYTMPNNLFHSIDNNHEVVITADITNIEKSFI